MFGGVAIAERSIHERACGVWVVNFRTGQTVAWLQFEGAVEEVFAVQVLPGRRFPDLLPPQNELIARTFVLSESLF